ncbi:hypothetical protein OK016_27455 [Vibrio chagasii]|nr:hypothetical protein [Vibrio chagasii]
MQARLKESTTTCSNFGYGNRADYQAVKLSWRAVAVSWWMQHRTRGAGKHQLRGQCLG